MDQKKYSILIYRAMSKLLVLVFMLFAGVLMGNYVENEPYEITQPDGSKFAAFVTGDEYYHRVHDARGYTLLLQPKTGYAVYAIPEGNSIKASAYKAGSIDPASLGIAPNLRKHDPGAKAEFEEIQRQRTAERTPTTGTMNSLVVFVRFANPSQTEFPTDNDFAHYNTLFNSQEVASLTDYYDEVSAGQLDLISHLFPAPDASGYVISLVNPHQREYFSPYVEGVNDSGYVEDDKRARRYELGHWLVSQLQALVPEGLNIDADEDGKVDGITMIVRGGSDAWGDILWPTAWSLGDGFGSLRAKLVTRIILDLETSMYINTVCHEMGHQLGAPDYYHYYDSDMAYPPWNTITPVRHWDMMSSNVGHWLTHTKFKYGHWFTTIPTITPTDTPTTYNLTAIDASPYSCYKIQSPLENQYYMLEYRRQAGNYETAIPGTGLIVYRVITGLDGNAGGPPDEVYVYRPGGTLTLNGDPELAFLSQQSGRTSMTNTSDQMPWLWVDTDTIAPGNISITNVGSSGGETISFQVSTGTAPAGYTHSWTGAESSSWHDPANWSPNEVPNPSSVVYIPAYNVYAPSLTGATAACRKLTVGYSGALLIGSGTMLVYEDLEVYGMIRLFTASSTLGVSGDIHWYSGSSLEVEQPGANIYCKGSFTIDNGAEVQMQNGTLSFASGMANPGVDYDAFIINKSELTILNNIIADKEGPYALVISNLSTEPFLIKGSLTCLQNRSIRINLMGELKLQGDLISENTNSGGIFWNNGTLRLTGVNQTLSIPHSSGYLRSLQVDSEGEVSCPHGLWLTGNLNLNLGTEMIVGANTLKVDGAAEFMGKLVLNEPASKLVVQGSISWEEFSAVEINSEEAEIFCKGSMTFESGANFNMIRGSVEFNGTEDAIIVNKGYNTKFHHLRINKTGGAALAISAVSTSGFHITGDFINNQNSIFRSYFTGTVLLKGNFSSLNTNSAGINWEAGTLELNGPSPHLSFAHPGDYLWSLRSNPTSNAYLTTNTTVKGDFTIFRAPFFVGGITLTVGGNWTVNTGASFEKGTSTVIFNGTGTQTVSSCHFNILRLNKTGGGANNKLLISNYKIVNVASFKYDAGTIEVSGGTFSVADLEDHTVKGNYRISSGFINLTQDSQFFVDLDANLNISGGKISINGGYDSPVQWAHSNPVTVIMSGGVLEYNSRDIDLSNSSHNLSLQISGGIIRTRGSFAISRSNTSLEGGLVELYGTDDATLSSSGTNSFYDVKINKTSTRANKVTLAQNVNIAGDLTVWSGTLALNGVTVNVGRDLYVYTVFQMNNTGAILNIGRDFVLGGSSNVELTRGTINITRNLNQSGSTPLLSNALNTMNFTGTGDSSLILRNPAVSLGNLGINKSSGTVSLSTSATALNLLGNMTVSVGNQFMFGTIPTVIAGALNVNGAILLSSGGSVTCLNLNMNGNITVAGDLCVQNSFIQGAGTQLIVGPSGNFIMDKAYSGSYMSFAGTTILNGGAITISNEGIQFGASSNLTINSGTLKIGWGLRALTPDSFHMSTGSLEFIGGRSASIQLAMGNYLNNVVISKTRSGAVMLESNLLLRDLMINTGTLQLLHHTLDIAGNLNIMNGTLDAAFADDRINLNGWWNNNRSPNGFTQGSGTVAFVGLQRSVLYQSEQFNNLLVNKTGLYPDGLEVETGATLSANNIDFVDGTIYLKGGSTFNTPPSGFTIPSGRALLCDPDNSSTLNLNGDFGDFNVSIDDNNGFSSGKSVINVSGSGDRYLNTTSYPLDLNAINVNLSSGSCLINSSHVRFHGNVDLLSGTLQLNMGASVEIQQNLNTMPGTNFNLDWGSLSLTGNLDSQLSILGSSNFGSLNINKTSGTAIVTLANDWIPTNWLNLNLQQGILDLNHHLLSLSGMANINAGGELSVDEGAELRMASGNLITVNSGGKLSVLGTAAQPALLSRNGDAYYEINILSGGTIAAAYAVFEYLDSAGVNVQSGGLVDVNHSFANCTFRNGSSGGVLLTLNNNQLLTIPNAIFPANTWWGNANVSKRENTGGVSFVNALGAFAGAEFESDSFQRLNWNNQSPAIAISNYQLNFGDVNLGSSGYLSFTISNSGSGSLVGSIAVPDDFTVSVYRSDTIDSNTKGEEFPRLYSQDFLVTPSASVTVQVTFSPSQPVAYNNYLSINHNAGAMQAVTLSGQGLGAQVSVNPPAIIKGILPGGSYDQLLQISDSGNQSLSYYASVNYLTRDRFVILSESFESSTFPPTGWSTQDISGTAGNWNRNATTHYPYGILPQYQDYLAYFNSYNAEVGSSTILQTGFLNFSGYSSVSLKFWMYHDAGYPSNADRIQVQAMNNQVWTNVGEPILRYRETPGWQQHTISLSAYGNTNYVVIGFLGISAYGNDVHIDNVVISGSNPPTGWVHFNAQSPSISGVLAPGAMDQHSVGISTYGMETGIYQAEIMLSTNDQITPLKVIPIEISVGSPALSVSPASLSFGNQIIATETSQSFSLVSTGDLHLSGTITTPAGYSVEAVTREEAEPAVLGSASGRWTSSLSYLLPPGETQNYLVRFTPTSIETYSGNLVITSDHLANQTIALSGTGANIPTVQTLAATSITSSSATLNAQISSNGGLVIWGRGFKYGTDPDPITNGNDYMVASTNSLYSAFPTGFEPGQRIYFCAFAYNELGRDYGDVLSFVTLSPQLIVNSGSLGDFGPVNINTSSVAQSFTVSGSDLTAAVNITASEGFSLSLDSGRSQLVQSRSQITLSPVAGVLAETTVYLRFEPTLVQAYSGSVTILSSGLPEQILALSGIGITTPTVAAIEATDISQTSASSGGNITSDGGSAITARGICWSELPEPDLTAEHSSDGLGSGPYVSLLTDLLPATQYYVRAYATNLAGTVFSEGISFITTAIPDVSASEAEIESFGSIIAGEVSSPVSFIVTGSGLTSNLVISAPAGFQISLTRGDRQREFSSEISLPPTLGSVFETIQLYFAPLLGGQYSDNLSISSTGAETALIAISGTGIVKAVLSTKAVTDISGASAGSGGLISSDGWSEITICGICWSLEPEPTTDDYYSLKLPISWDYNLLLNNLLPNTTYFVRAFAINGAGTAFGNELSFSTTQLSLGIPTNLQISLSSGLAELSWDLVPGAVTYKIFRSSDPYPANWGQPIATTANRIWTDTTPGNKYFYRVQASTDGITKANE